MYKRLRVHFNFPIIFLEHSRFRSGAEKIKSSPTNLVPRVRVNLVSWNTGTPPAPLLPIPLDKGNAYSGNEK